MVQSELRKVSFALPEGFEKVTFHPLGHRGRHTWPFAEAADRRLVISPFLAAGVLQKLSATGRDHVLVSRLEELEAVEPAVLARFSDPSIRLIRRQRLSLTRKRNWMQLCPRR